MKYFKFSEFEKSEMAKTMKLDNSIPDRYKSNIEELVDNILDPIREFCAFPIVVTSGYRSDDLNRAVGGKSSSAHLVGYAADIKPYDPDLFNEFVTICLVYLRKRKFDQIVIYENFIHISYKSIDGKYRRQIIQM